MAQKIVAACGGSVKGLKISVLGIAFKPNTDDVRDAPSLVIIPILQELGAQVVAHDPVAMEIAKPILKDVTWVEGPYEAADKTDALVIITEWNEYRALDLEAIAGDMNQKCLIDLRNIYKVSDVEPLGFHYVSVGRGEYSPFENERSDMTFYNV